MRDVDTDYWYTILCNMKENVLAIGSLLIYIPNEVDFYIKKSI